MDTKKQREHLDQHTRAVRDIELTEAAINILESVSGAEAQRCIKRLKTEQQRQLRRIDAAASQARRAVFGAWGLTTKGKRAAEAVR